MLDSYQGLIVLVFLAVIHLYANQAQALGWIWHGRFISFAAGISFAYVFVDLLPTLESNQPVLQETFSFIVPYFDRHAYFISLLGVLFYYGLHTNPAPGNDRNFWLSMSGYILFNFFLGATLSDSTNPDIQPLILFAIGMAMHYFVFDHNAYEEHAALYNQKVRWLLVSALFIGYLIGFLTKVPPAMIAIIISFLSGGVFLNALRYELPKREHVAYFFFVLGALSYSLVILSKFLLLPGLQSLTTVRNFTLG